MKSVQIQPPTSTNMLDSHILCKITIRFKIVHVVSRCQKKNLLTKNSFFCYIFHSSYIECHKCIIYARRLSVVFIVWNSYNIFSCTKKIRENKPVYNALGNMRVKWLQFYATQKTMRAKLFIRLSIVCVTFCTVLYWFHGIWILWLLSCWVSVLFWQIPFFPPIISYI